MALRIATGHAAAQCGSQAGRRDRNGAPIEIDPQPGDPAPTPADVETMSQRLDMLDELTAQKHMTPAAFDRRVEILNETVGEGSALGQAFEAVAEQGRAKLCGEDEPSHDLAVAKAHALASDPSVHAAMRENREALERLTPEERAAAKATRYALESDMRDLMAEAQDLSSDDPDYDRKIAALEARYEALLARDAGIPGVPHPDVDPGLAHDLGHTADDLLESRAAVQDIVLTAGLAVTPWGAGRAAARLLSKGAAKVLGGATGLGAMGVDMKRAAGDAIGAAARAEFEARGLDPKNPGSFADLPPDVRRKIAVKGAVAAMVNGASTVAARQIVKALMGPAVSELQKAMAEEITAKSAEEAVLRITIPRPKSDTE